MSTNFATCSRRKIFECNVWSPISRIYRNLHRLNMPKSAFSTVYSRKLKCYSTQFTDLICFTKTSSGTSYSIEDFGSEQFSVLIHVLESGITIRLECHEKFESLHISNFEFVFPQRYLLHFFLKSPNRQLCSCWGLFTEKLHWFCSLCVAEYW